MSAEDEVSQWMEAVSGAGWNWYVKYLAGNDTFRTSGHQAGPYVPKPVIFRLFPALNRPDRDNPRHRFHAAIDSHGMAAELTAIWYNNKLRGGTRDECRITGWGGIASPILDPEATGSLCLFAVNEEAGRDQDECRIWLCSTVDEENSVQGRIGPVEPGAGLLRDASGDDTRFTQGVAPDASCRLRPEDIPVHWRTSFPRASEVVGLAVERLAAARGKSPDERLVRRRACEFEIFRSVEEVVILPRIKEGFATVGLFVDCANSVTNRRKSRSGSSLELHARTIFDEEHLKYSHDQISEESKRPDFLFPSVDAYRNLQFDAAKLRMLGVKTTCKDRWRQVINEADRIPRKHLLTLQEGISPNQFKEMAKEGVVLVVPKSLHSKYDSEVRPHLLSFERFIDETRANCF
jgi:hypothetical protein